MLILVDFVRFLNVGLYQAPPYRRWPGASLALCILKMKDGHVCDDQFRTSAWHAKRLSCISTAQVARTGEKVQPLDKSTLLEVHYDEDTLCIDRNLAGSTTSWQPGPGGGIAADHAAVQIAIAINLHSSVIGSYPTPR